MHEDRGNQCKQKLFDIATLNYPQKIKEFKSYSNDYQGNERNKNPI